MKRLFSHNKTLFVLLLLSLLICLAYIFTYNMPQIIPVMERSYVFLYDLALAYIASYVFYIVQVYLPELKSAKAALPRRCATYREAQIFIFQYLNMWQRIDRIDKKAVQKNIAVFLSSENVSESSKRLNLTKHLMPLIYT